MPPQAMTAEITKVAAAVIGPAMIAYFQELYALFNGLKANSTIMSF